MPGTRLEGVWGYPYPLSLWDVRCGNLGGEDRYPMRDPRLDRLADVIVSYSTAVKPGDVVRLTGEPVAGPLMEAIYERLIRAGAHVAVRMTPGSFQEIFFRNAGDEQLEWVSPLTL